MKFKILARPSHNTVKVNSDDVMQLQKNSSTMSSRALGAESSSRLLTRETSDVRNKEDIRRHYIASIKRANTSAFVDNLEVANNAMLDRLKQIGKIDSDGVKLIEISPDLRYRLVLNIGVF
jgi:hypothetical protein